MTKGRRRSGTFSRITLRDQAFDRPREQGRHELPLEFD